MAPFPSSPWPCGWCATRWFPECFSPSRPRRSWADPSRQGSTQHPDGRVHPKGHPCQPCHSLPLGSGDRVPGGIPTARRPGNPPEPRTRDHPSRFDPALCRRLLGFHGDLVAGDRGQPPHGPAAFAHLRTSHPACPPACRSVPRAVRVAVHSPARNQLCDCCCASVAGLPGGSRGRGGTHRPPKWMGIPRHAVEKEPPPPLPAAKASADHPTHLQQWARCALYPAERPRKNESGQNTRLQWRYPCTQPGRQQPVSTPRHLARGKRFLPHLVQSDHEQNLPVQPQRSAGSSGLSVGAPIQRRHNLPCLALPIALPRPRRSTGVNKGSRSPAAGLRAKRVP